MGKIPLLIWSFYAQWFWLYDRIVILFVFSQYNLSCEKRINSITESSSFISWVIECVMRLHHPIWISVTIPMQQLKNFTKNIVAGIFSTLAMLWFQFCRWCDGKTKSENPCHGWAAVKLHVDSPDTWPDGNDVDGDDDIHGSLVHTSHWSNHQVWQCSSFCQHLHWSSFPTINLLSAQLEDGSWSSSQSQQKSLGGDQD